MIRYLLPNSIIYTKSYGRTQISINVIYTKSHGRTQISINVIDIISHVQLHTHFHDLLCILSKKVA